MARQQHLTLALAIGAGLAVAVPAQAAGANSPLGKLDLHLYDEVTLEADTDKQS